MEACVLLGVSVEAVPLVDGSVNMGTSASVCDVIVVPGE